MKKPRSILIAAVCMVLIAAIAAGCTFAGGKITEPETTEPPFTDPTPSTQFTGPGPSAPDSVPNVAPSITLSPDDTKALKSAEELIYDYMWYKAVGVCCEFEMVSQDLSRFLTEEQQAEYCSFQYLLKCCHSAQDVKAHIDSRFDAPLLRRNYPDDRLFTDDKGNLYLIVFPTEYNGYRHITLNECSDDRIIASACIYDEDECWCRDTFTMVRTGEDFKITQLESTDTIPETPSHCYYH